MKDRILIIEDDPWLGPSLIDFLEKEGFYPSLIDNPLQFQIKQIVDYDILVLDLILPHINGEKILKSIKEKNPDFPILVLTAKSKIENKKECFELGADDYLVKPFDILELILRIKAILRRKNHHSKLRFGNIEVDLFSGIIKKDNEEIKLSKRAWDLLCYLIQNKGKIVSKKEILAHVWKDVQVTEDSVRTYIKELRKIFPNKYIETIKGRGYILREK